MKAPPPEIPAAVLSNAIRFAGVAFEKGRVPLHA